MFRKFRVVLLALVVALPVLGSFSSVAMAQTVSNNAAGGTPTVHVSGAGAVTAVPDLATITLGVTTRHAAANEATRENNRIVEAVFAALREMGISDNEMATRHFSVWEDFSWDRITGEPTMIGYISANTIEITIRDIDKAGEVIGAGVAAGATTIHGVHFSLEDSSPLYLQALAIAVKDAAAKANAIAGALGTTIAGIQTVVESGMWYAPIAWADARMEMAVADGAGGMHVPIQSSELVISARVEVVYNLR
jgi:hypothetical protein